MGRWLIVYAWSACMVAGCGIATTLVEDDATGAMDAGHTSSRDVGALPPHDAGHDVGMDAASNACLVTCTSDSLCAASCGAVPGGGIRCCDFATSRCFVSHTAACPVTPGRHDAALMRPDTTVDSNVDAACRPSGSFGTTEIAVSAPGMAGATVRFYSYYGASVVVTLDATGSAVFTGSGLYVGDYFGGLGLCDASGSAVSFELQRGTVVATIRPVANLPDLGVLTPLDRVDLIVQRDRATGLCAGNVLSVVIGCVPVTSGYVSSMFDDMPCGPFR